jgi:hypothetical protein
MRYIVGVIVLLVAVCTVGAFFVEEGFGNVNGKTASDYYKSVSAQMGPSYVLPESGEEDISGSDISGTPNTAITNPSSYSESLLLYAKNAKVYPDGSTSSKSSPGSSNHPNQSRTPFIDQGQMYDNTSPASASNDTGRYASPSQLMPGENSYAPHSSDDDYDDNDGGRVAVRVNRNRNKNKCPDMSQYVKKDAIPCWGCKL